MAINFDKALQYPLAPLPLALATVHGTRRNRPKSNIMETIFNSLKYDTSTVVPSNAVYVNDLIVYLYSLLKLPAIF